MPQGKKAHGAKSLPHPRCAGKRKDGTRCTKPPLQGKVYCWLHSEDREVKKARTIAQFKGGIASRLSHLPPEQVPHVDLSSMKKIQTLMEELLVMTLSGDLAPAVSRAAKGILDSHTSLAQLSIADRLAKIEERMSKDLGIDFEHED